MFTYGVNSKSIMIIRTLHNLFEKKLAKKERYNSNLKINRKNSNYRVVEKFCAVKRF